MNEHAEQIWPVDRTPAEAEAHDPDLPALVPLPGHLVRPIHLMISNLHIESPLVRRKWRKQMGIEPTRHGSHHVPTGFEDRASHQCRCCFRGLF